VIKTLGTPTNAHSYNAFVGVSRVLIHHNQRYKKCTSNILMVFGRGKSVYDFEMPLEFLNLNFLNCKAAHINKDQREQGSRYTK